ncbi:TetR/AcrR family transcriptional regulator [Nocardioides speluncae]|uniref:TetR/AcrR family transcriptional regulator n=1 Tax=Nocardioides speluncae TaxID=2670337 RepID=UPI001F0BFB96|nr:TetR/AcrR family transcriptional regulator [Nocardioides speluncae]
MPVSELGEKTTGKRADARKNIAAIVEAAISCLARDPDVSINEIAKAAGVGRVTLYGHFESRAALVGVVVEHAMQQTDEALDALDLEGDPRAALARLIDTSWQLTHRYGALVIAAEQALPPDQVREAHSKPIARWQRLLRRGRRDGAFRKDMPLDWQVSLIQAILHGASAAVHRGEITPEQAPALIRDTVLGALTPPSD